MLSTLSKQASEKGNASLDYSQTLFQLPFQSIKTPAKSLYMTLDLTTAFESVDK